MESGRNKAGFTLVEMAVVLLVLSLLAAAATRYALAVNDSNNLAALNGTLDAIDTAMMNFRNINSRLPCPAVMNPAGENSAAFGAEGDALPGDGLCTLVVATPGTTGWQSSTSSDPYSGDANYANYYSAVSPATSASANSNVYGNVVGGAVPTKALKIADKYAYDPWGRLILYAVDLRYTLSGAFNAYTLSSANTPGAPGVIVITTTASPYAYSVPLAQTLTYRGIYALVAFGENGHGGYVRNMSAAPSVYNAGSTNTDELQNCHCNSAAAAGTFDRVFVQNTKNNANGGANATLFDDVVRFKTRTDMASPAELQ